jgi:signal transduction histidine kinase/CheY-like chemotaxis protein
MRTGRVAWSDELYAVLGRSPEQYEATFDNFIAAIHPDDRVYVESLSVRATAGDVAERADFRIQRPDGSSREVTGIAQIFRAADGAPHRMVGVIVDRTERRRLEEQLHQAQKMEALGRLAGGVAHDFNNLLTVVLLNAESLRKQGADERLDQIYEAASKAAALTAELLAFSRKSVRKPVALDLNDVVEDAVALVRRVIGEDIDIDLLRSRESPIVLADESQLHQVVLNLAVNARDAMPEGGKLTLSINVVSGDGAGVGHVRLSVRDTGTGMDSATKQRAFEPFFTTKEPGKGTGLGLATVFGIVAQSGGFVEIDSEPQRGSTFHVFLPRAETEPAPRIAAPLLKGHATGAVLLVAEDDPAVRGVVCGVLREAGYEVLEAARPSEALELWRRQGARVALLLSDVVMPQMNGEELVAKLRVERPALPVVFVTGYDPQDRVASVEGARCLTKPFSSGELLEVVRETLAAAAQRAS